MQTKLINQNVEEQNIRNIPLQKLWHVVILKYISIQTILYGLKSEKQQLKTNVYLKIRNWLYKFQDIQILKYILNRDNKCYSALQVQISWHTQWLSPGPHCWANLSGTFELDPCLQDTMARVFSKHCSDTPEVTGPVPKWDTFQKKLTGKTGLGCARGLVTGVKTQVSDRTWLKGRKTICLSGQLKTVVLKHHLGEQQFHS